MIFFRFVLPVTARQVLADYQTGAPRNHRVKGAHPAAEYSEAKSAGEIHRNPVNVAFPFNHTAFS